MLLVKCLNNTAAILCIVACSISGSRRALYYLNIYSFLFTGLIKNNDTVTWDEAFDFSLICWKQCLIDNCFFWNVTFPFLIEFPIVYLFLKWFLSIIIRYHKVCCVIILCKYLNVNFSIIFFLVNLVFCMFFKKSFQSSRQVLFVFWTV